MRWDIASGRPEALPIDDAHGLVISADGRFAAATEDLKICRWETARGWPAPKTVLEHGDPYLNHIDQFAFSADGSRLAAVLSREVRVWDAASLTEVARLRHEHRAVATSIYVSPGARFVAAHYRSSGKDVLSLRAWDTEDDMDPRAWTVTDDAGHSLTPWFYTPAFSADGRVLAHIDGDSTSLWDTSAHKPLGQISGRGDLWFSPDGQTLAMNDRRTVRLWDVATLRSSPAPLGDPAGEIERIAFSPDWHLMATATHERHARPDLRIRPSIRLWRSRPVI